MGVRALAIFLTGAAWLGAIGITWSVAGQDDATSGALPASPDKNPSLQVGSRAEDYSSCQFLARSPDNPYIPSNWARVFSGHDLFRDLGTVQKADYLKKSVAVIDTGLDSRKNPMAGPKLQDASVDQDYDLHGTHVAGIVSSECCGVNPRLSVIPYAVPYVKPNTLEAMGSGFQGFHGPSLLEALAKAARDPKVGTINLSISSPEDAQTQELVEEATRNGKFVVFAGGNRTAMGDRSNTGLLKFKDNPRVFSIGSLSYLGTPSEFSAYGPTVDFFAHGSAVDSLSARFNPNLVGSKQTEALDGTSMAAPDFSAVIQTLQNIAPTLDPRLLRQLLKDTAIVRGDRPPVMEENPLLAAEVLGASSECRKRDRASDGACLTAALTHFSQNPPQIPPSPKLQKGQQGHCDEGERYYAELRRGYFLTRGGLTFARELREFFGRMGKSNWAEASFFFGRGEGPLLPPRPDRTARYAKKDRAYMEEVAGAHSFLSGERTAASSLSEVDEATLLRSDKAQYLKRLTPGPESVSRYLQACSHSLWEKTAREDRVCSGFLYDNANAAFLKELGRQVVKKGQPLASIELAVQLGRSEVPADQELYKHVLSLTARGWTIRRSYDDLAALRARFTDLGAGDRSLLIAEAKRISDTGQRPDDDELGWGKVDLRAIYLDLLTYGTPAEIKGRENEMKLMLTPDLKEGGERVAKKDPSIGVLAFEARRAKAGYPDREAYLTALDNVLSRGRELSSGDKDTFSKQIGEWGDNAFIVRSLLQGAQTDPEIARGIARKLSDPELMRPFMQYAHGPVFLKEFVPILSKSGDGNLVTPLLQAGVDSWRGVDTLYPLLELLKDVPEAKAYLDRMKSGPQSVAVLQAARLDWLQNETRNATQVTPEVRRYFEEATQARSEPLLVVNRTLLVNDPELRSKLEARLDALVTKDPRGVLRPPPGSDRDARYSLPETGDFLSIANRIPPKELPKFLPLLTPRLAGLWRNSNFWSDGDAETLGFAYAYTYGADRKHTEAAFAQAEQLLREPAFLSRAAQEREEPRKSWDATKEQAVIRFMLNLAQGKEGAKYWEAHPTLADDVAQRIAGEAGVGLHFRDAPIPNRLLEAMRKRLPEDPTDASESGKERYTRTWVREVISRNPAALERGFGYIASAVSKGNERLADDMRYSISRLVLKHPELKERVRARGDQMLNELLDREEE